jgi:hypothetical protein
MQSTRGVAAFPKCISQNSLLTGIPAQTAATQPVQVQALPVVISGIFHSTSGHSALVLVP